MKATVVDAFLTPDVWNLKDEEFAERIFNVMRAAARRAAGAPEGERRIHLHVAVHQLTELEEQILTEPLDEDLPPADRPN